MSGVPEHDPLHPEGSGTPDESYGADPQPSQQEQPEESAQPESSAKDEQAEQPLKAEGQEQPQSEQPAEPAQSEPFAQAQPPEAPVPSEATEQPLKAEESAQEQAEQPLKAEGAERLPAEQPVEAAQGEQTGEPAPSAQAERPATPEQPEPWSATRPEQPATQREAPYPWSAPFASAPQAQYENAPPPPGPTFFSHEVYPPRRQVRIPNFGHLAFFALLAVFGMIGASIFTELALHENLFGVGSVHKAITNIHYTLGSEAIFYLITFVASLLLFPLLWRKGFMAGLQWNGGAALRRYKILISAAFACFLLALLSEYLMPGPSNAPIDKIFNAPGAAWLLFAFGVTFAPFFEEMIFRGFILPAFCTGCDWVAEKLRHEDPLPIDENGHPRWSFGAMVFASVATSIPFALLHAPQTGYSLGPFVLLISVSLVLCWARLSSRSLAASVMIHASYNFMLFTLMLIGTGGFTNMHRM